MTKQGDDFIKAHARVMGLNCNSGMRARSRLFGLESQSAFLKIIELPKGLVETERQTLFDCQSRRIQRWGLKCISKYKVAQRRLVETERRRLALCR